MRLEREAGEAGRTPEHRERSIVDALANGELRVAAHELVRGFADEIYRFCVHAIGNKQDGEDLAQETLGEACRGLARFRRRSSVRTWLYGIAWNKVHDRRRVLARQPHLVPIEGLITAELVRLGAGGEAPDDMVATHQRRKHVSRALKRVSAEDRMVLFLRVNQELSFEEIAGVLDVREGAAKMRMNRAVSRLRDEVSR